MSEPGDKDRNRRILEMWAAGHDKSHIAQTVRSDQKTVSFIVDNFGESVDGTRRVNWDNLDRIESSMAALAKEHLGMTDDEFSRFESLPRLERDRIAEDRARKKVDEAQQDLRDRLMDGLSGRDHLDAGEGEEPEERQSDLVQSRRQVDTERLEILSVIEELESVFQQTEDLFRDIATGKPADKASWQQCIDAQELRVMEKNLGAIKAYASTPDLHDVDLVDRLIAAQLGAYIAHLRAVTLDSTTPGWDTAILSPPV